MPDPDDNVVMRTAATMSQARRVLDQIADKWIMTLAELCPQPAQFNEIWRRLGCITHRALAHALKRLERNGLVTRTVLATQPVGVEYAVAPLGHSLRAPCDTLAQWAFENRSKFDRTPGSNPVNGDT